MGILGITTQFCSITVFHEIPDIYTVFGSAVILSSAYMITYLDSKNATTTNDKIKKLI